MANKTLFKSTTGKMSSTANTVNGAGGTCCSAPLKFLNDKQETGDLIIYVSDNESWIDSRKGGWGNYGPTATEPLQNAVAER